MRRGSPANRLLDFWVGIPLLQGLAVLRRRRMAPASVASRFSRIGVMCSPALGDTLLFSAVLQDVRTFFPAARITHFCMKQNLAAAEILAGADRRVLLDLTRPWAAARAVRRERVELMLDFSAWQRLTAFLTLTSGAALTAGFETAGQHRGRAYDVRVTHRADQHELENFRDLVRALRIPATHPPRVEAPAPALEPFAGESDLVALHPWASGALSALREWPQERWGRFASALARAGTLFVITGGPGDRERTAALVERLRGAGLRAQGFVGPDGFVSLVNLIGRARLVASVNTGVMHLAAILGAPTLCLNGPTNGLRWGPVGPRVAQIAPADGSGGYLNLGFEFGGRTENVMEKIPVEQAVAAAEGLMSDG
jgi:ADP-heptose:LPS heptosyltransferase